MTAHREPSQSFASARALVTLLDRTEDVARTARLVRSLERHLERARREHDRALADYEAADALYMATPYCDEDEPAAGHPSAPGPSIATLTLVPAVKGPHLAG